MDIETEKSLQLWGGVECTVNRVGDRFFSQLERNGHCDRAEDLDRFASLGLRTLRFPVLWEMLAPHSLDEIDWSWPDERLERAAFSVSGRLQVSCIMGVARFTQIFLIHAFRKSSRGTPVRLPAATRGSTLTRR